MEMLSMGAHGWAPYTGIWYRNDPSFEYYAGGQATFPSNIRPMAIYDATANATFFTWGDKDGKVVAASLDHGTMTLSEPFICGSYSDGDAHKNGSILMDQDGYLYVFSGGHGDPIVCKRSSNPRDPSSWLTRGSVPATGSPTYPQPWQLQSNEVIMVLRTNAAHLGYTKSTDGGATWGAQVNVVQVANPSTEGVYFITIADDGAFPRPLHAIWNLWNSGTQIRKNFWYARSLDGGATWQKSDGAAIPTPMLPGSGEMVLNSGNEQVNTCDLVLDSTGLVRALVLQGLGNNFVWKLIRQDGPGDWSVSTLPPAADHHFDIGALVLVNDDDWRAYLPSGASLANQDGGEIEEWRTVDRGAAWSKHRVLTSGSTFVHNNVKVVMNGTPDCRVFWSYGDPDVGGSGTPLTSDVKLFMAGDDAVRQMAQG